MSSLNLYIDGELAFEQGKFEQAFEKFKLYREQATASKSECKKPSEDWHLLYLTACWHELNPDKLNPYFELSNAWLNENKMVNEVRQTYWKGVEAFEQKRYQDADKFFREYRQAVNARKVTVLPPQEDRHLFYLKRIQEKAYEAESAINPCLSDAQNIYEGLWNKWVRDHKLSVE